MFYNYGSADSQNTPRNVSNSKRMLTDMVAKYLGSKML